VQMQLLSEMNWRLIITMVLMSGVLAYIGDKVGMHYGKKRISFLTLRPRHTSQIITVLTGILISIAMLVSFSFISESVRTALFSMKFIQTQITKLTADLQASRDEAKLSALELVKSEERLSVQKKLLGEVEERFAAVTPELEKARNELERIRTERTQLEQEKTSLEEALAGLRSEAETLRAGLSQIRSGRISVFADELLAQKEVLPESARDTVERAFSELRRRTEFVLATRLGVRVENVILAVDIRDEQEKIAECAGASKRKIVRALADSNVVAGEDVRIRYEIADSALVYAKDTVLHDETVNVGENGPDGEALLYTILQKVNQKAVKDGIMPNPATGKVGALGATEFFNAVEQVRKSRGTLRIVISAADDLYTEGPVQIVITVRSEGAPAP
jgi:uncharacterized protein (DUF3084 family)